MSLGKFISHGIPSSWPMGRPIYELLDIISNKINSYFPDPIKNFIVDTTWLGSKDTLQNLYDSYKDFGPIDNLFLCTLIDDLPEQILQKITATTNSKIYHIGAAVDQNNNVYEFNAAAIISSRIFKSYTYDELKLSAVSWPFICYQNKPSYHRQLLTRNLLQNGLINRGLITLGESLNYQFSELYPIQYQEEFDPAYWVDSGNDRRENPYSLGDIIKWQQSFLCIVSETNGHGYCGNHHFITEKTWKPIIGLRPFVIFGHPNAYKWLDCHGFDTFADIWPEINQLKVSSNIIESADVVTSIAGKISSMNNQSLETLWYSLHNRLIANQSLFYQHAADQTSLVNRLFNHH